MSFAQSFGVTPGDVGVVKLEKGLEHVPQGLPCTCRVLTAVCIRATGVREAKGEFCDKRYDFLDAQQKLRKREVLNLCKRKEVLNSRKPKVLSARNLTGCASLLVMARESQQRSPISMNASPISCSIDASSSRVDVGSHSSSGCAYSYE